MIRPSETMSAAISQIIALDLVFSIDSILTAVGMTDEVPIMITAVVITVGLMMIAANPLKDRTYFAQVFQDNAGSARVLTNAGFQYLGDAESFSVARQARVPTWTYLRKLD